MSIFDTLAESGVTQEDLEKAASARLFAEAAAAEGIDLSELSEDQAEELYEFWSDDSEKNASADAFIEAAAADGIDLNELTEEQVGQLYAIWSDDSEKNASADAFLEDVAAEGIDLNEMTEDQVGELYNYWATGGEEKVASAEELLQEAAVKEASAKLAEAEYIGRYMARVYADEMGKIADSGPLGGLFSKGSTDASTVLNASRMPTELNPTKLTTRAMKARAAAAAPAASAPAAAAAASKAKSVAEAAKAGLFSSNKAKALGALGAAGVAGAGAYGVKKLMDRKKSEGGEKQSSAFDAIVEARAFELLKEAEEEQKSHRLRGAGIGALTAGALGAGAGAGMGHAAGNVYRNPATKQQALDTIKNMGLNSTARQEAREGVSRAISTINKLPLKRGGAAIGAAGLGALGAGAGLLHGHMKAKREAEKQSSIDDIIEARAIEMLEEAQFAEELDEAALELLAANGY